MKKNKWTLQEQASFLKMIGELLIRGYPLAEALDSATYHLPRTRHVELKECLYGLKEGYPFYIMLRKLEFNEHVIGYVYFAEQHGSLAMAFLEGSKMLQKRATNLSRIKKLLSYPLFLVLTTIMLFFFVQKYLLPQFSSLFTSMKLKTNLFTRVIYSTGEVFPLLIVFFLLLLIGLILYYLPRYRKNSAIDQKQLLMRIPVVAGLLRLFYTHYFSVQLGFLLEGGLSVNESLTIFEQNENQPFYRQLGGEMKQLLISGEKLEDILRSYAFFEQELPMVVKHGQDNGKLAEELQFFSGQCMHSLEEKMDNLMKKIQPVLYGFIGLLIISMYLAVLLPMFHLMNGL
ncbi:competence type IV pilus assembly protein ComGB [Bacillus tuaregi]|uniref:competence type IV pilus assembly protein ComGB n=1 Tax=Bacillus tuaregi TaxID=1816695 RepID=UPI0008F7FB28|nr:competence type IV pilus assembly protein ComGB [Bacillus tuaregi]